MNDLLYSLYIADNAARQELVETLRQCQITKQYLQRQIEKSRRFISEAREYLEASRAALISPSNPNTFVDEVSQALSRN